MVAPTADRRMTGLLVATKGRGVTVVVDGASRVIGSEPEIHTLVDALARRCRRDEEALWRAHVRLGAAIEQIAEQVPWGGKKTIYQRLGVHAGFGQKCRRLARAVCDRTTWIVDERGLAEAIAESRTRDRAESKENPSPPALSPEGRGSRRWTAHPNG